MNTIDDFLTLLSDELGLVVNPGDTNRDLDEVAGWDSFHLLSLFTVLERRTGHSIPFADVLAARSLEDLYHLARA